jgi:spermidine synthase
MNDLEARRGAFAYHENLIHPALTAHPAPRKALVVGGNGSSAAEARKHPSAEVLEASAAEAPALLRSAADRFDFIALDLGGPIEPPQGLDTVEFLRACRAALAPGGALALPIGLPVTQPGQVAELAQRLSGVFRLVRPCTLFVPYTGTQCALAVCADRLDPKSYTADEIDRRIEQRRLSGLRYYNGETHEAVFALPNYVRDLVAPVRLRPPARAGLRLGIAGAAAK